MAKIGLIDFSADVLGEHAKLHKITEYKTSLKVAFGIERT